MSEEVEETEDVERSTYSKATKVWRKGGTFGAFSDAADKARELIAEWDDKDLEIRIRRAGGDTEQFRVKYWHPSFTKKGSKK